MFDICHAIIINRNFSKKEISYEGGIKSRIISHNHKFSTIPLSNMIHASYFIEIAARDLPNISSEFIEKFGGNSFLLYPTAKISFYK